MTPQLPPTLTDEIYLEHAEGVLRCARALLPGQPAAVAEEVAQQAWFIAVGDWSKYDPSIADVGKWVRGIVRNLVRGRRKHFPVPTPDRELAAPLDDLAEKAAEMLEDHERTEDLVRALRGCLEKLADPQRRMVEMKYRDDKSLEEIAAANNTTSKTVKTQMARIRVGLSECVRRNTREGGRS